MFMSCPSSSACLLSIRFNSGTVIMISEFGWLATFQQVSTWAFV